MGRSTSIIAIPGFVADQNSVVVDGGHQIDWANVADSYKNSEGKKVLPAGTEVGELLGGGKISPRIVTTNPAIGLLAATATEGDPSAAKTGYGVVRGASVYENMLPNATGTPAVLATAVKTELRANGYAWLFRQHKDSRIG